MFYSRKVLQNVNIYLIWPNSTSKIGNCLLGGGSGGGAKIKDFQYDISRFWEKYGRETVFLTLDDAGD